MWVGLYLPRCPLGSPVGVWVDAGCQRNSCFLVIFSLAHPKRAKSRHTT